MTNTIYTQRNHFFSSTIKGQKMFMMRMLTIFFLLFFLLSCETDTGSVYQVGNINVLSVDFSGCKNEKSALLDEYIEKFIISYIEDGVCHIEHENVWFNCCLPKGIELEVNANYDTIIFSDREKEIGICDCICPYNTFAEIAGIDKGNHVLCFKSGDDYLGSVELFFKINMYEEILVSELADY